jgi:protein-tyrosine-phosphatase
MEALLREHGKKLGVEYVAFESAGAVTGAKHHPADEGSVACMQKRGINLSEHRARHVDEIDLKSFDLIVTTCPGSRNILLGMNPYLNVFVMNEDAGGISKDSGEDSATYDKMAEDIAHAIPAVFEQLAAI